MIQNMFGTDGIRSKVGSFPFTYGDIQKLGHAIGKWLYEKYGYSSIVVGTDTRNSKDFIKTGLSSPLLAYGHTIIDIGVASTPALYHLLSIYESNAGIMISASHNPYHDNGVKIFETISGKLAVRDEEIITAYFYQSLPISYEFFGSLLYHDGISAYKQWIATLFPDLDLAGKKIVIDCAHGATSAYAYEILKNFNAEIIMVNNQPNGFNINLTCGATHPQSLRQAVLQHQATLGFAFDGDGDRLIACNSKGEIKHGDHLLALLLHHPRYQNQQQVVGTIMTNKGFELFLHTRNISLIRTPVGDKYIAQALQHYQLLLGGEPSGHIIVYDLSPCGDALINACMILQTLQLTQNWDLHTFHEMPQIHYSLPVAQRKDLNTAPLNTIIQHHEKLLQQGRIIVRYSGTEPVLRIMIEDHDVNHAQCIGDSLSEQLKLSSLT